MTVNNLPSVTLALWVSELDLVGNNVDRVGVLLADKVGKDRADDRGHARTDNDDGKADLLGELVKFLETGVEGDVWRMGETGAR